MKNISHEQMKKFCKKFNTKLFIFEPMNSEKTEYRLTIKTGIPGPMPEFSVTKKHFIGLGANHQINLTNEWIKYQEELKLALINETNLSL